MKNKMIKKMEVPMSLCDHTASLSIPGIFALFMDLASEHGDKIELGMDKLAEKGAKWIITKTKVRISERPRLLREVSAVTWPEKPGRVRCNRYYMIAEGEKHLVEGKTEWVMLEKETDKLFKIADAYPPKLIHCEDILLEEPYAKITDDFTDAREIAKYTVNATDIDMNQHMNNAAYVKVLFSAFPSNKAAEMNITEIEVAFKAQCYEGEELTIRIKDTDCGYEAGIIKADGTTAAAFVLTCNKVEL